MAPTKFITVLGTDIGVTHIDEADYICLTDIVRNEEGNDHIRNWMRNRNTVEYLGIWEQLNNPEFKGVEFDTFRAEAGLNSFNLTPKKWIEATNAIGIISKSGRYGGTYAHKDIAFEFGAWISAEFKLYIIREYQRLKEVESNNLNLEWDVKRTVSKVNYTLHTESIKEHIIPKSSLPAAKQFIEYAQEADLLNVSVFGLTAKQWKDENPERVLIKENMRDCASINELVVLSNLESMNSVWINQGKTKEERFKLLKKTAQSQLNSLNKNQSTRGLKKLNKTTYVEAQKRIN